MTVPALSRLDLPDPGSKHLVPWEPGFEIAHERHKHPVQGNRPPNRFVTDKCVSKRRKLLTRTWTADATALEDLPRGSRRVARKGLSTRTMKAATYSRMLVND